MTILLIGEYSNVHATLAKGLRSLGHQVTVMSNGDFWKDYPRDIDVARRPGKWGGIMLMAKIYRLLPRLKGYDVVQLINPLFLEIKAHRLFPIYRYLRRHNCKVVLGAFGMDWYWVHTCVKDKPLRYSDFNIGNQLRTNVDALKEQEDWMGTDKERLNKFIANDCDGIVAGLYEYWVCYHPPFPDKTEFIPYPIETYPQQQPPKRDKNEKLRLFIGINRSRSEYKGTDIMLAAAEDAVRDYPDKIELRRAESVPFAEYIKMMEGSDAILDQLYSYTPSMNPLEAMSKGIICIGGGEPENYEILGEDQLRPIVNVAPTRESVYQAIVQLALHPERITVLQRQSIDYIRKHHDAIVVARKYEKFYQELCSGVQESRSSGVQTIPHE